MKEPFQGTEWARGVVELAEAIEEDRPARITDAQVAHVVDILCAIQTSFGEGHPVTITSEFAPPAPMDWARD